MSAFRFCCFPVRIRRRHGKEETPDRLDRINAIAYLESKERRTVDAYGASAESGRNHSATNISSDFGAGGQPPRRTLSSNCVHDACDNVHGARPSALSNHQQTPKEAGMLSSLKQLKMKASGASLSDAVAWRDNQAASPSMLPPPNLSRGTSLQGPPFSHSSTSPPENSSQGCSEVQAASTPGTSKIPSLQTRCSAPQPTPTHPLAPPLPSKSRSMATTAAAVAAASASQLRPATTPAQQQQQHLPRRSPPPVIGASTAAAGSSEAPRGGQPALPVPQQGQARGGPIIPDLRPLRIPSNQQRQQQGSQQKQQQQPQEYSYLTGATVGASDAGAGGGNGGAAGCGSHFLTDRWDRWDPPTLLLGSDATKEAAMREWARCGAGDGVDLGAAGGGGGGGDGGAGNVGDAWREAEARRLKMLAEEQAEHDKKEEAEVMRYYDNEILDEYDKYDLELDAAIADRTAVWVAKSGEFARCCDPVDLGGVNTACDAEQNAAAGGAAAATAAAAAAATPVPKAAEEDDDGLLVAASSLQLPSPLLQQQPSLGVSLGVSSSSKLLRNGNHLRSSRISPVAAAMPPPPPPPPPPPSAAARELWRGGGAGQLARANRAAAAAMLVTQSQKNVSSANSSNRLNGNGESRFGQAHGSSQQQWRTAADGGAAAGVAHKDRMRRCDTGSGGAATSSRYLGGGVSGASANGSGGGGGGGRPGMAAVGAVGAVGVSRKQLFLRKQQQLQQQQLKEEQRNPRGRTKSASARMVAGGGRMA